MGCDIHLYREKMVDGKWVSADKWTPYNYGDDDKRLRIEFDDRAYNGRNYNLFTVLAGVRRRENPPYEFAPRGMPLTVSPEVASESETWGGDGHSHSYLYLHELIELRDLLNSAMQTISGMKDKDELAALQESIASGNPDWDLLYPYCQSTNDQKQVEFEIEVPANFAYGDSLEKIVSSLENIGGECQRIVFWFDN